MKRTGKSNFEAAKKSGDHLIFSFEKLEKGNYELSAQYIEGSINWKSDVISLELKAGNIELPNIELK